MSCQNHTSMNTQHAPTREHASRVSPAQSASISAHCTIGGTST